MLFSYRATSEQVDPGLQPFTNLKPQRKLSEILFGLLVFEKLNSQTIIPPSFGWTSLICLFHIQKTTAATTILCPKNDPGMIFS